MAAKTTARNITATTVSGTTPRPPFSHVAASGILSTGPRKLVPTGTWGGGAPAPPRVAGAAGPRGVRGEAPIRGRWFSAALTAFVLAILLPISATAARADVLDEAWKRGNDAYFRGDYDTALTAYEQIDGQNVVSPDLYYNLGVAHFRKGSLGRAVWSFERALALDPGDDDARFNLTQARKLAERRVRDRIEGPERDPAWIRVVTFLTGSTQAWLFVALYFAFFAVLFLRRRAATELRAPLAAGAVLLGTASAFAGLLLAGRVMLDRIPFAVVLPDTAAVKEGADPNHRTSFALHAGLRVRLLEQDQDWVRIRLANGLEGWVRNQDVGAL